MDKIMSEYKMTIGLEIHAELKTKSKMFCGCKNSPHHGEANSYICPVCLGYPGTLPTINKEAVKKVLTFGSAIGAGIADFTEFDRKNYFYPDIPKGYQISQYKYPLVSGGEISGVKLTRVHLEEDTARSSHDDKDFSLVDFNRAGVPLMELVTEPVMHSSEEVMNFAKELQLILQYLDISEANMEKGEMRVEVNISVSKDDSFGTKVEVKNINSFKSAGRAIDFEFKRQVGLLDKGEKVVQETRGFDENKGTTFSQRSKENANDYRYFPDPDLPKLVISEVSDFSKDNLNKFVKELPKDKREKYSKEFGIKDSDIEVYINNRLAGNFFDEIAFVLDKSLIQTASNYITSDLIGFSKTEGKDFDLGCLTKNSFVSLIEMIKKGELSSRAGKDILKILFEEGGDPKKIAEEKGLLQKSDPDSVKKLAEKILEENPDSVKQYKEGKESLLQFFVGQGMKESKGSINPEMLKTVILELLVK